MTCLPAPSSLALLQGQELRLQARVHGTSGPQLHQLKLVPWAPITVHSDVCSLMLARHCANVVVTQQCPWPT